MAGVIGQYVRTFAEATHCVFNGHLDDPHFREIAFQRIVDIQDGEVTLSKSGALKIRKRAGREQVMISYSGFFGKESTSGHPFKDDNTEIKKAPCQQS